MSEPSAIPHQPSTTDHQPSPIATRKSRSRFALLPQSLRDELNRKLDDGRQYEQIRHWLFELKADRDIPALNLKTGDPYSLVWTRTIPDEPRLIRNFGIALSGWYHTHFQQWRDQRADRDESLRLLENIDQLTTAATTTNRAASHLGGNHLIRTVLLDAIRHVRKTSNSADQLARLAHAWARLSQTDEHNLDTARAALTEEINANPEALAHARQMFDAIEAAKHQTN
jgi:hypothetical protein